MSKQVHDGQRLKKWIELSGKNINEIVKGMEFTNYSHLYYYYPQERIKKNTLEKFCQVLKISIDDFYNGELIKGSADGIGISFHQGKNLEAAVKATPITDTAFAAKLGISRKTLYAYYKLSQLDESILKKAAKILHIQPAALKGIDVHEWSINDLYYLLKTVNEKVDKLAALIPQKKSTGKSTS